MFDDKKYTSKDIQDMRDEIIEYIKEYNPDWTDFNWSSIQLAYTEICAGVADMLLYYLDNQALECFLSSARQEKNIRGILSTVGYEFDSIGSATGTVTFERKKHEDEEYEEGEVYIPVFTAISSKAGDVPEFVTAEDAYMYNEDITKDVSVIQGVMRILEYPEPTVKDSYKLYLTESAVPLEYVEIINEGWERVEDAFVEVEGGKKYSVHVDSKGMVYILFTFDWKKYLSDDRSQKLQVRLLESVGSAGNIEENKLDKIEEDKVKYIGTDEDGSSILKVYNSKGMNGGFDTPDLGRQKANAKNWLKTYDRIILRDDYETMLKKESWIRDCQVYDWRRNDAIVRYPHIMKAFVVTDWAEGTDPGTLRVLKSKLQDKTVAMTMLELELVDYVDLDIVVTLKLKGTTGLEEVRSLVERKLHERYSYEGYLSNAETSALGWQATFDPVIVRNEVIRMSESIIDAELNIAEPITLSETQFFNPTVAVKIV